MKLDLFRKTNARDGFAQLVSVAICTAILFLFVALTYSRIVLPHYTTNYTEKDVQQVVNLIITVIAAIIGILFSHCRRLTNEAETQTELRDDRLTIPRLHVHFEAASGSKVAMGIPVARNREVWRLVAYYFLAMMIFAFVHSVLAVIFVIDATISEVGELVPVHIPLSVDIPWQNDPCITNINDPGCAYTLALTSLTAQLVAYQPYTIAGVTFQPPNGTMGLPYYAMDHFRTEVAKIPFEDAHRRYCLPVLDPHLIRCHEMPINHTTCESIDGKFVRFKSMNVSTWEKGLEKEKYFDTGVYRIASPFPSDAGDWASIKFRVDVDGQGVMIAQRYEPNGWDSLVGGANAWGEHGYASQLHRLMYDGKNPNTSTVPDGATYDFAAKCTLEQITDRDNYLSSWRQVDFFLGSGALRANVTEERCENARATNGKDLSGFGDLSYAIELASTVISSPDGYSKFFNEHPQTGEGSYIFQNMSRLDAILNQMYHIVQTHWTQSLYEYSKDVPTVLDEPIIMTSYPHLFVIRISWTPTTWIGLVLSTLITLNAWMLAFRWLLAKNRFGFGSANDTWNLLRPIELMAYTLAASRDVFHTLDTTEHRKMEMRGQTRTLLHEYPMDMMKMMAGDNVQKTVSDSWASTPVREHEERPGEVIEPNVSAPEHQPNPPNTVAVPERQQNPTDSAEHQQRA